LVNPNETFFLPKFPLA